MRVYQGDSIVPNDPRPHTFVEVERDSFLEVTLPELASFDDGDKQRLRAFTRKVKTDERKTRSYHIRLHTRFFTTINKVPNLRLIGTF